MKPILFEIFGVAFPSYYLMLAVGYSLAVWYVARLAERDGLDAPCGGAVDEPAREVGDRALGDVRDNAPELSSR